MDGIWYFLANIVLVSATLCCGLFEKLGEINTLHSVMYFKFIRDTLMGDVPWLLCDCGKLNL